MRVWSLLLFIVCAMAAPADAALFKCVKDGRTEWTDRPCEAGTEQKLKGGGSAAAVGGLLGGAWRPTATTARTSDVACMEFQSGRVALVNGKVTAAPGWVLIPYRVDGPKVSLCFANSAKCALDFEFTPDGTRLTARGVVLERSGGLCPARPGAKPSEATGDVPDLWKAVEARCAGYPHATDGRDVVCRDMKMCAETGDAARCDIYCDEQVKTLFPDVGPGSAACQKAKARR